MGVTPRSPGHGRCCTDVSQRTVGSKRAAWEGQAEGREGRGAGQVSAAATDFSHRTATRNSKTEDKNNLLCRQLILVGIAILLSERERARDEEK